MARLFDRPVTRALVVSPRLMTEEYYDENRALLLRCLACRSIRRSRCRRCLPLWRVSAANRLGVRRWCLLQEGACSRRRAVQNLCPRWAGGTKAHTALLPDVRNDGVLGCRLEARP